MRVDCLRAMPWASAENRQVELNFMCGVLIGFRNYRRWWVNLARHAVRDSRVRRLRWGNSDLAVHVAPARACDPHRFAEKWELSAVWNSVLKIVSACIAETVDNPSSIACKRNGPWLSVTCRQLNKQNRTVAPDSFDSESAICQEPRFPFLPDCCLQ